jgi:hypothetical protein
VSLRDGPSAHPSPDPPQPSAAGCGEQAELCVRLLRGREPHLGGGAAALRAVMDALLTRELAEDDLRRCGRPPAVRLGVRETGSGSGCPGTESTPDTMPWC